MPDIIKDPPISEISFKRAIIVIVLSASAKRCGICIVIIKMKSRNASISVENFTSILVTMLMLAAISIIPVSIIVYAPSGTNDVSIPR